MSVNGVITYFNIIFPLNKRKAHTPSRGKIRLGGVVTYMGIGDGEIRLDIRQTEDIAGKIPLCEPDVEC